MPPRKPKRTAKIDDEVEVGEIEVEPAQEIDAALQESVSKALEAARLADDAAQEVEDLRKENDAFVEKIEKTNKRISAVAIGAAAGATLAMALSGLVYFRSVADLREAAELQAEAMARLMEQNVALKLVVEEAANQQGAVQAVVMAQAERISLEMAELFAVPEENPADAEALTGLQDDVAANLDKLRTDMTAAIADLDLSLSQKLSSISAGGTGVSDAALVDLAGLIQELKTTLATRNRAPAAATPSAPAARPATPPAPRASSSGSSNNTPRRSTTPAPAPETNPFSFP